MKTISRTPAVFRLRKKTGFASQRDLWSFALFVAERTGEAVVIEGVKHVRAGKLDGSVPMADGARTSASQPDPKIFRPRRRTGLALKSDLVHLHRWLEPIVAAVSASDDKAIFARQGAPGRLPLPSGAGLLLRDELLPYLQAAAAQLGARVEARDIIGSRETAGGLHINRRHRTAAIRVEIQNRTGHGKACYYGLADPIDDGYITVRVRTNTYANGSYTETWTASGDVQGVGPGGTFDTCADVTYDSTLDPDFDYGAFVSLSDTDTVVPWDDVIAAAAAEVDDDSTPYDVWTDSWEEVDWRTASGAVSQYLDYSESVYGTIYGEGVLAGWNIRHPQMRVNNEGDAQIEIEVTFTRQSDSTTEVLPPIVVLPHASSDWIDLREADPGEVWDADVTSLSIAGF